MIRKTNLLLIIISIIVSFYFVFTRDINNIGLILKDASIIITITGIYIIEKIFKLKINDGIKFIYVLFIFTAHFLGATCELYNKIFWFDKFSHFVSGILTSFAALLIINKSKSKNSLFFNILFIISFSMLVASLWEVFEYLASYYFKMDPQRVTLTGVTDTMGDIIVALLGTILLSTCYYFEHSEGYNLIVKKFENMIK